MDSFRHDRSVRVGQRTLQRQNHRAARGGKHCTSPDEWRGNTVLEAEARERIARTTRPA
jgi:hypothetical protein